VEYLDIRKDKGVTTWHGCVKPENTLFSFSTREDDFILGTHDKEVDEFVTSG
jgi:hypothetical protein